MAIKANPRVGKGKPTLLDWLGLRWEPDYSSGRWLGGLISVTLALILLVTSSLTLFQFFMAVSGLGGFGGAEAQSGAIRNIGLVLAAAVGLPFLVWRSVVAQKQVDVVEQGQITDRIAKAVDQLGHKNTAVRMGAIHSLERIMVDSEGDRVVVMRTMNAYLKHRQSQLPPEDPENVPEVEVDMQAALDVILRWDPE